MLALGPFVTLMFIRLGKHCSTLFSLLRYVGLGLSVVKSPLAGDGRIKAGKQSTPRDSWPLMEKTSDARRYERVIERVISLRVASGIYRSTKAMKPRKHLQYKRKYPSIPVGPLWSEV